MRIWKNDALDKPIVFRHFDDAIDWAGFSPDGQRIAAVTHRDPKLFVWNSDGTGIPLIIHEKNTIGLSTWSPDGQCIAATSGNDFLIWSDLVPVQSIDDERLWKATSYCMSIATRIELLHVSEAIANVQREACLQRVRSHSPGD